MRLRAILIIMFLAVSLIPIVIIGGSTSFEFVTILLMAVILLTTFTFSIIISYFITRPLEKLTRNIDEISKGKLDVTLDKSEIYEINKLTHSLDRVMASLKLAIHKVGVKKGEIFQETVKAKQEVECRYQDLLKTLDNWVWETDPNGVYVSCTPKVKQHLGYTPQEIIGKSIYDFISSEDVKRVKNVITTAIKNKAPIEQLEFWCQHKSGKKTYTRINAVPVLDETKKLVGYRGVEQDITNIKNAEIKIDELNNKIGELRTRVRGVLNEQHKTKLAKAKKDISLANKETEQEFDEIFIFDDHANIVDCTENLYKKLGYTKGEMLSLNITDFDALQSKHDIQDKISAVKKAGKINFKTIHKRKDGSAIPVTEIMHYLKDSNTFKCVVLDES